MPPAQSTKKKKKKGRKRKPKRNALVRNPRDFNSFACGKLTNVIASRLYCRCSNTVPRWYDSSTQKTIPAKFVTRVQLDTITTSGVAAIKIQPSIKEQYELASTVVGGIVTVWGTAQAATGYTSSDYDSYRIVSLCAEYIATTNPSQSQGVAVGCVTQAPMDTGATSDDWDLTVELAQNYHVQRQYQSSMCLCAPPQGSYTHAFHPHTITAVDKGFPHIYVGVRGGDTTAAYTVGEVVITMCVEMIPDSDTLYNTMYQQPAPYLPQLEAAISNAQNNTPRIVDQSNAPDVAKKTFWDAAESAAVGLVEELAPAALGAMLALL